MPDYIPRGDDSGGAVREGISEQDLAAAVAAGARVRRVVVVEVLPAPGLVPHLLLSDRPGWHPIAMRKYEGIRSWKDYRNLRRSLAGFGFHGVVRCVPQGHPVLPRIGIGPGAAAAAVPGTETGF